MEEDVDLVRENDRFYSASALLLDSARRTIRRHGSDDWRRVLPEVRPGRFGRGVER